MSVKSTTIAQLFKTKGYRTGIFGKWHLELSGAFNPGQRRFDETLTCIDDDYKRSHFNPTLVKNGTQTKYQGYRTDIFFDEALKFIERSREAPFFLYLATHSPHSPHKVPAKRSKPYEAYKSEFEGKRYSSAFNGQRADCRIDTFRIRWRYIHAGRSRRSLPPNWPKPPVLQ